MENNIRYTEELDRFKLLDYNRDIKQSHVEKITNSILKIGYLSANPIIVSRDGYVLDGQHRLEACKKLGIGIYYCIAEDADSFSKTANTIVSLNTSAKLWTLTDYTKFYASNENENYKRVNDFALTYDIEIGPAVAFISRGNTFVSNNGNHLIEFKRGMFVCSDADYKLGAEALEATKQILQAGALPFNRYTYGALLEMARRNNRFSWSKMVDKVNKYRDRIYRCTSKEKYIEMFSDVYNYKERTKLAFMKGY